MQAEIRHFSFSLQGMARTTARRGAAAGEQREEPASREDIERVERELKIHLEYLRSGQSRIWQIMLWGFGTLLALAIAVGSWVTFLHGDTKSDMNRQADSINRQIESINRQIESMNRQIENMNRQIENTNQRIERVERELLEIKQLIRERR